KESLRWRRKFLTSTLKWKRVNLQISLVDNVLFKVASVLEAIVLVATLSFFLPLLRLPLLIIDFKKELENWSSLSRFDLFVFFLRGWKYGFFLLFLLIFV
ncbi:unnamed protein product, partial [Linum tenue]